MRERFIDKIKRILKKKLNRIQGRKRYKSINKG